MNYERWLEEDLQSELSNLISVSLVKVNKGNRYRIGKDSLSGSLWLEPREACFRLKLTGDIKRRLAEYVGREIGEWNQEDQGDPVWRLHDPEILLKVLAQLEAS